MTGHLATPIIPRGGYCEKNSQFHTLWEAENFVLHKTKGGKLLVRVTCEAGDTRTAKIESFFSGLFSCGAPRGLGESTGAGVGGGSLTITEAEKLFLPPRERRPVSAGPRAEGEVRVRRFVF